MPDVLVRALRVGRVRLMTYAALGLLVGIATILYVPRLGSASADWSTGFAAPLYAHWQDPLWLATGMVTTVDLPTTRLTCCGSFANETS